MNKILVITATVLFALPTAVSAQDSSLAASHDLRKEGGKTCMSEHAHTGSGTGTTKASARAAAIRSWIEFTNWEYGRAWASFSNSAGQTTRYTKEASGWSATVDGRPCRR